MNLFFHYNLVLFRNILIQIRKYFWMKFFGLRRHFLGNHLLHTHFSNSNIKLVAKKHHRDVQIYPNHHQNNGANRAVKKVVACKIAYVNCKKISEDDEENRGKYGTWNSLFPFGYFKAANPIKKAQQNKVKYWKRDKSDYF